ncbi:MAG TPA: hypothetical protein VJ691_01715 [Vicinamibacterales bacterium]|nr:hypothetical protein [Vicinamibacterales bacterium]
MTGEFDYTRAAFRSSRPARAWAAVQQTGTMAWRRSPLRAAVQRFGGGLAKTPRPILIRAAAVAVAVAAGLQPILMWMMPPTVRPAIPPYVFIAIALLAAVAAWRCDDVATAWPSSRAARWLRR